MKKTYDWNEDTITCTCPVCGYKHTKETGTYGKTLEGDKPFVEMDFTLHSEDSPSYYSELAATQCTLAPNVVCFN